MAKNYYIRTQSWVERNRFQLLLLSTILTLVLPAFSDSGRLSELIFVITLSFLFIQSMIVANVRKEKNMLMRSIVIAMVVIIWLKPAGIDSVYVDLVKLGFIAIFFIFVMSFLVRFISNYSSVNLKIPLKPL